MRAELNIYDEGGVRIIHEEWDAAIPYRWKSQPDRPLFADPYFIWTWVYQPTVTLKR